MSRSWSRIHPFYQFCRFALTFILVLVTFLLTVFFNRLIKIYLSVVRSEGKDAERIRIWKEYFNISVIYWLYLLSKYKDAFPSIVLCKNSKSFGHHIQVECGPWSGVHDQDLRLGHATMSPCRKAAIQFDVSPSLMLSTVVYYRWKWSFLDVFPVRNVEMPIPATLTTEVQI